MMSSTTANFFKCLICKSFFGDLLKTQRHVDKHGHDKKNDEREADMDNELVRRRGMLPIEKVTFTNCFVPLTKVQTHLQTAVSIRKRTRRQTPVNYVEEVASADVLAENKKGQVLCPVPSCNFTHHCYSTLSIHLRQHIHAERKELVRKSNHDHHLNEKPVHFPKTVPKNLKIFQCKFCLRKERSLQALNSHQDNVHAQQLKLKCLHCDQYGFEFSLITFIGHMKTCHPNKLDPNGKRFERPMIPKNVTCDQCQYSCHRREQLNRHVERHVERVHPQKKKPVDSSKQKFSCPVCGRVCCSRESLQRHFHLHLENNPFTCDFPNCGRKYAGHYNLQRHKLRHDEAHVKASQQKCDICGATYVRKETLDRHVRVFHNNRNQKAGIFHLPHKRRSQFQTTNGKASKDNMPTLFPPTPRRQDRIEWGSSSMPVLTPSSNDDGTSDNCDSVPLVESQVKYEPGCQSIQDRAIKVEKMNTGEEINLVDRILLDEDGTAVHIKGERLTPQARAPPKSSEKPSTNATVNESAELPKYSPYDVIAKDPAFQKIAKKDPSVIHKLFSSEHIKRPGNYFSCTECLGVFNRAWTLQLHMRTQHKKTIVGEFLSNNGGSKDQSIILMCAVCAYPAQSKDDLTNHMKSHKDPDKINQTRPSLGRDGDVPCNFCDEIFETNLLMKRHEYRVHWSKASGDKRKCPICNEAVFPKRFYDHTKKHQKDEAERPRCMLCQDSFSCRMALQRHIDCVHLGKPLNKIRYIKLKARKKKASADLNEKMAKGKVVKVGDSRVKNIGMAESDPKDGAANGGTVPGKNLGRGDDYNKNQNRPELDEFEAEAILGP